ncbi:UNVERIFIED_CONTAM: hypothetical protein HHA_239010 [Hammondia hammondi]|eukprot:XP_008887516.1 hypothetical protein HHA_239010 [Hammondia hammondi]
MRTGHHRTGVRLIICSLVLIAVIVNTLGSTPWLAFASAGTGKEQGQKPDSPPSPHESQRRRHSPPRLSGRKRRRQRSPSATPPQSKQAQFAPSPEGPASPQKLLELPGSPSRESVPPRTVPVGAGVRGSARPRPLSPLTPSDQLLFGESSTTSGGGGKFNVDDFFATTQPPGSREEAHSEALLQTPPEAPLQTPPAAPLLTPPEPPLQIPPEPPLQTPPDGPLQTPVEASLQAATAAPLQTPPVGQPSQQQAHLQSLVMPVSVLEPSLFLHTPGPAVVPPLGGPIPQYFVPVGLFPSLTSGRTGSSTGARAHGAATGIGTAGAPTAGPSASASAGTSHTTGTGTVVTEAAHAAGVNAPRDGAAGDGFLTGPVYYLLSAVPTPRQVAQRVIYAPRGTSFVLRPPPPFFPPLTGRGRSLTIGSMGAISLANATERPVVDSGTDSSSSSPLSSRSHRSRSSSSSSDSPLLRRRWLTGSSTGSDSSTSSRASYTTSDPRSSGTYLSPFSGSESSGSRSDLSTDRSRGDTSDGSP